MIFDLNDGGACHKTSGAGTTSNSPSLPKYGEKNNSLQSEINNREPGFRREACLASGISPRVNPAIEGLLSSLSDHFLLRDSSFSLTAALMRSAMEVYSGCFERYFSICSTRGSGNETVRYPFGIDYAKFSPYLIELQYISRTYSRKGYILRYIYFNYDGKWRSEESARIQIGFAS
jgi:hypothetical protein